MRFSITGISLNYLTLVFIECLWGWIMIGSESCKYWVSLFILSAVLYFLIRFLEGYLL